jgi:hypothetical protein
MLYAAGLIMIVPAEYGGETILGMPASRPTVFYRVLIFVGFNRGDNNRSKTFAAVVEAKRRALRNLVAIELGNEPDGECCPRPDPTANACPSNHT